MTSGKNLPDLPARRERRKQMRQAAEGHTGADAKATAKKSVPTNQGTAKKQGQSSAQARPVNTHKIPEAATSKSVPSGTNANKTTRSSGAAKAGSATTSARKKPAAASAANTRANAGANKPRSAVAGGKQPLTEAKIAGRAKKKPGNPVWRWVRRIFMTLFLLFLLAIISGSCIFLYEYWKIKIPSPEKSAQGQITTVYFADGRTKLGTLGDQNRIIIDTAKLPEYVGQAVVASEDRTFFQNNGIDFKGIARALWNNIQGKPRQGASTLSQQYVERYYTGQNDTYASKFKETILALKINRTQSKQEILNNYLNTIYFGRGAYGIEAAAQAYFHKPAEKLTVSEAALLAGIIPAPSLWDPAKDPEMAKARWQRVINNMVTDGWLQADDAKKLTFPKIQPKPQQHDYLKGPNGYLLNQVKRELQQRVGYSEEQLNDAGIKVVTTIDPAMQQKIIETVQTLPPDKPKNLRVAMTALDSQTGAIVAEYAGPDYLEIQRNAATQDRAQAGSTFKAFTLLAALEQGHSLDQLYDGNSVKVGDKVINNYANAQYGMISLRTALRYSVNGVFIRLNQEIGPDATRMTAIKAGIPENTPGLNNTVTNTLGTSSPHNIDLAHAYSTFASGGINRSPHIVSRVLNSDGDETYHWIDDGKRVFQQADIAKLTEALNGVCQEDSRETGFFRKCGAKTGSAEDNKAAQFVGFNDSLTTAVSLYQVGPNGEEQSITPFGGVSEVIGETYPARLWGTWMNSVDANNSLIPSRQTTE